ncbi:PIG-L family deacetylase [Devosia epidermidihirudinis]|uniref:PIG-L family deacetylase n=1 Tax=Devosia epidermidihirudinis TaxID=1293439 RepID=UPI00069800F3|nr:PIG-L family deacetylase [Devosia epidermidihirudinis]
MTRISRRTFIAAVPPVLAATQIPAWAAPATDLQLIAAQKGEPPIVKLYRQLERLTSTVTLMTTGAHPDDEPSGMLAALRHVYGIRPVLYCITRGEGGQNAIGPERGSVLGVLRTREMTEASRSLDASLAFGGQGHNDSVHDFGFSKDPNATIDRWGRDRVIERMTWAFRYYRPDVIMNCFLDVGGQHGHHRAANVATFVTAELSGNAEEFPEQIARGLKPWTVPKIYLPAYGGGGGVYDDETPPPPTTLTVRAPERDPISGATFPQMGEWSRSCHLTQGMGSWRPDPQTEWALNLAWTANGAAGGQESDIREGLIATVGHIAELDGMPASAADALRNAQGLIDEAIADYGDPVVVLSKVAEIGKAIALARETLPAELADSVAHRLDRKAKEVDLVLATAAGMQIRAYTDGGDLRPGQDIIVKTLVDAPDTVAIKSVAVIARDGLTTETTADGEKVSVAADAALTNPLAEQFDPLGGNGDAFVRLTADIGGHTAVLDIDLEDALRVIPAASLELKPDAIVLNTVNELEPVEMTAVVSGATTSDLDFNLPEGWAMTATGETGREAGTFDLTPPADLGTTRIAIEPSLLDQPAYAINTFSYPHIGKSVVPTLVSVPVQSVEAALPPGAKVGYVGSGNDNVAIWLKRLGVNLVELSPSDIEAGAYRGLTTIIVGIFAFGRRKDLVAALPGIHEWVRNGGHLVTLYHRPSDGWDPATVPLAFLKIGTPSIRYRVTDAKAEVTALEPDHPLLNYPNVIGPEDWANWDKERGLYFVSEWDEVYKPLLSMSDAGEEPLLGSLMSAEIGEGRHTHTSLVLHHQLDKLTPGAFRLLANLTQPAKH